MHEAGAAVVAAQLLAFYREPVRHRPRLTHGREPFSGGLLVFRFAQGRFPQAMMRELSAAKRDSVREAAVFFVRQVCLWEGASHYQVLCVPTGARRETIKEHYHGLMALIHPDRQDPGGPHWPAEHAQRVNKAYEVLSDDERRREYDAGLHKATVGSATLEDSLMAAPPQPSPGAFHKPPGTRLARMRKPVLFISLAVSLLFFVQVWWAGEIPGEYSAIPSAAPFEMSLRWMREAYSSGQKASPQASGEPSPAKREPHEEKPADTSLLAPLWRTLSRGAGEPPRPQAPQARRPQAAEEGVRLAASVSVPVPEVPAAPIPRKPAERTAPPRPAERSAPPRPTQRIAQASVERRADGALSAIDMETLVAKVVTHYEAGDVDKLLGLYDASSVGLWQAMSLRHDFEEFFRSTRTRRLRLQGVSWDTDSPTARVTGAARLVAEYNDDTGRVERQVSLEMDVVSRDGEPRIARLSLFPHER
jgi:curved DNA-binding protein CbpA